MNPNLLIGTIERGKSQRDFALPLALITETIAILAKRGAGKTYLMRKIAEAMIVRGLPVVIIDPIGVCWGLRSSADGKGAGLDVIIFGGDHGDLPLEPESGRVLAEWVVAERRPVVFDLSAFPSKSAERRWVADFAETIYRKNRDPLHIMLDEADNFAPQQPQQGDKRMLGAINTLARRGRARGIGMTLATQRSAVLNKNVLTQAEILVAMRMTAPQDRKAIEEWIKYHGDKEDRDKVLGSLSALAVGEAWFWSPGFLDGLHRVKVGKCDTFDSSATPKAGATIIRPELGPIDLPALNNRIQATIERAKAEDPRELHAMINRMGLEIGQLKRKLECVAPPLTKGQLDRLRDAHILAGDAAKLAKHANEEIGTIRRDLGVWPMKPGPALSPAPCATEGTWCSIHGECATSDPRCDLYAPETLSDEERAEAEETLGPPAKGNGANPSRTYDPGPIKIDPTAKMTVAKESDLGPVTPLEEGARKLKGGERRVLTALAQHGEMDKRRLAALTGYKMSGGGFQNILSALRTAEEITRGARGITVFGRIEITDTGRRSLGNFTPLPTGPDLLSMWLAKLPKAPRLALEVLARQYPRKLTRTELAEATGYSATGGGFQNGLSKLNTLGLIDRTGTGIRASENLFP